LKLDKIELDKIELDKIELDKIEDGDWNSDWDGDENKDELYKKNINNKDINVSNLFLSTETMKLQKYINDNPQATHIRKVYRRSVDCKKCIIECKKKDSNIFEWDISCDPNCSSYKIFDNGISCSHVKNIIFMADGKIYNPEFVEIYINGKFIKKLYSNVFNNLPKVLDSNTFYKITDCTYPLLTDTIITLKIKDSIQISKVFFNLMLEKIMDGKPYLNDLSLEFFSNTHELLYEGTESNILINLEYGFYQDIWVVCDDIVSNINSISMSNSDVILLQDIPIQLLEHTQNLLSYSLKIQDMVISGIKIDTDFEELK